MASPLRMIAGSHAKASSSTSSPEEVAWLCEALKALVQPDSQWYDWKYGSKIHYRYRSIFRRSHSHHSHDMLQRDTVVCATLDGRSQDKQNVMNYILCRQKGRSGPRILLVHGFGVGSFQFIPLMEQLAVDHQVWALDLLGQGLSWPSAEALAGVLKLVLQVPLEGLAVPFVVTNQLCHLCIIQLQHLMCGLRKLFCRC